MIRVMIQDTGYGIRKNGKRIALFAVFMFLIVLAKCFYAGAIHRTGYGTFGLLCLNILQGMSEYIPAEEASFSLPTTWLLMVFFIFYIQGDYVRQDLSGFGLQRMVRIGGGRWWLSKCVWLLATAALYMGILYGMQFLLAWIMNGGIVLPKDDIWIYEAGFSDLLANGVEFWLYTVVVPCLCVTALSVWSVVLSLLWDPVKSFLCATAYMTLGILFLNPFFIGNQLMLARSDYVTADGYSAVMSLAIDLTLIVGGVLSGYAYIKNRNFLG